MNKIVKDRSDALDEIIPLASQFEQSKSDVSEWLKAVRPKVEGLEVVSVDKEKLLDQEKTIKVSQLEEFSDFCLLISILGAFVS